MTESDRGVDPKEAAQLPFALKQELPPSVSSAAVLRTPESKILHAQREKARGEPAGFRKEHSYPLIFFNSASSPSISGSWSIGYTLANRITPSLSTINAARSLIPGTGGSSRNMSNFRVTAPCG